MESTTRVVFEDHFPKMLENLGASDFMKELWHGYRLLMDEKKGVITLESLKRNATLLGVRGMTEDEATSMLREGDLNGDGVLNEMEFCTLMFRLSPDLMRPTRKCFAHFFSNVF